ncbi:MAG: OmpA family protein [Bacteroidota bacterium]
MTLLYSKRLLTVIFVVHTITLGYGQSDEENADHPLVSRYEGFKVEKALKTDFDQYRLPLGPSKSEKELGKAKTLEGKITRINYAYRQQPLPSLYQLFKNYENAFKSKNIEILFSCMKNECGFRKTDLVVAQSELGTMINAYMRFGTHAYLAGRLSKDGTEYHIGVYIREEKNQMQYELHIIESDELNTDKVTVADIESSITETGKKAFYGIYFDTGKATITAESAATLEQIAAYLKNNSNMAFYVVGHTDDTGSYESNLKLSADRASSVVRSLEQMGVDISQLKPIGVGPVAPEKINNSESNRAKNRRVELVLK